MTPFYTSQVLTAQHAKGKIVVWPSFCPMYQVGYDYCAILEREEGEQGQTQGWGDTPAEALADLIIELED